jgi:UDP:flavonoid glycosyltransferase YjiC (YdhE family)
MPEQALTAQQIAARGLGIHLDKAELTAELLQKAVVQICENPTFRANARTMQKIVRQGGGYREAADTIQRFVTRGKRL